MCEDYNIFFENLIKTRYNNKKIYKKPNIQLLKEKHNRIWCTWLLSHLFTVMHLEEFAQMLCLNAITLIGFFKLMPWDNLLELSSYQLNIFEQKHCFLKNVHVILCK